MLVLYICSKYPETPHTSSMTQSHFPPTLCLPVRLMIIKNPYIQTKKSHIEYRISHRYTYNLCVYILISSYVCYRHFDIIFDLDECCSRL